MLQTNVPKTKQTQTSAPARSKPEEVLEQKEQVAPELKVMHHFGRMPVSGNGTGALVQPKLTINQPGDEYEQEADRMAEKVVSMQENTQAVKPALNRPKPIIQRENEGEDNIEEDDEEEETDTDELLMRKAEFADGFIAASALDSQLSSSRGRGNPLPEAIRSEMEHAFDVDFSRVRVHIDAQAAEMSRDIQARAFTHGRDIYFNHEQYNPSSENGKRLLAHELTHVVQQVKGLNKSNDQLEQEAERAEKGQIPKIRTSGLPTTKLQLSPDRATRLLIVLIGDQEAQFTVETDTGVPLSGVGSARGILPGNYRVYNNTRLGRLIFTASDGSDLALGADFYIEFPSDGRRMLRLLRAVREREAIPLGVRRGHPAGSTAELDQTPTSDGSVGSDSSGAASSLRQQLDALPQRLRDFLFSATGPAVRPEDIPTLLRIADAVSDLSDDELLEYRARVVGTTTDVSVFERGVTAWLAEVRQRHAAIAEEQTAANQLYGQEALYDLYLNWLRATSNIGALPQLAAYEATPFASLRVSTEGLGWRQYYEFRRALDAAGYPNISAFEAALQRFLNGFRERAYYIALESMGRYEHFLTEQRRYYQDSAVLDALHTRLAPARRQVVDADSAGRSAVFASMGEDTADLVSDLREEQGRLEGEARTSVSAATADTDPIAIGRAFDPLELARQDRTHIGLFLVNYIDERLGNIHRTRENLAQNHEIIFRFNELVQITKQRSDIDDNTIWARVIADHSAPSIDDHLFGIISGVLLVALTIATAGTGLPAVLVAGGSLLVSGYFAVEAYEDYAQRSDAYGAELLSTEPWFGWVVIAVVGAGLDLAAVGGVLRALRPAVATLEATSNLAAFNTAVHDLVENPQMRRAILEAAAARAEARAAWREVAQAPTLVPRGAARASLFGIDVAIDAALALPRTVYAVWLEAKASVRSFQRWILTPEAVELFGDVSQFSPAHLREVQSVYQQASAALERVATHTHTTGMSPNEVEGVLRWWARSQRGTADDLISLLDRQAAITIEASVLARMGAEVDVSRVRIVAATIDDPALRAELLSDGRVWRMLHNADYNPDALRRAWIDFRRVRRPSERLESTTFGEYLYRTAAYRTTIGRAAPRPLSAVIPNWASLVGAQRTQAVFQAAEPRLAVALTGTNPVPGLNPETVTQLRELLQTNVVGPGVTMYEVARGTVMGQVNEIIGRTTRSETELRAILALTDSSGSAGSIGERFVSTVLAHPAFAAGDLTHVSFSAAELPGLRGGGGSFVPDRIIVAAHQTLDVKTGYAGGINITDQAHNYELLRTLSQANPTGAVATRLGGPLSGHNWLVLPGAEAAATTAQTVARRIWSQLESASLSDVQRVFYLDDTGAIMRVTGPRIEARAGATIHEALGLHLPPSTP